MIKVKNLRKSFSDKEVLKGVSFSIRDSEFYGLLGPNGAGKTTIISVLSSLLPAEYEEIRIGNFNLETDANKIKRIIGVVPQEIALYNELSAMENLKFWGGLYNISGKELHNRAKELLQLVGLEERGDDKVKTYSGGMKRRVNIAAALIHKPKILFMDEPTVGIDPQSRNLIYEIIERLKKEGVTIVYTTHYMEEAEKLIKNGRASSVLIFHKGYADSLMNGNSLPLELRYDEAKELEVGLLQQSLVPTLSMLPFSTVNSKEVLGKKMIKSAGVDDEQSQQRIQLQSDGLFDAIAEGIAADNQAKSVNPASAFFSPDLKMTKLIEAKDGNQLGLVQAVAGTAVMMLLFSVVGIGMGLLDEKKEGTLRRLLYSPVKPENILLGKMISANIISVAQLMVMFLFAKLAFGLELNGHLPELLLTIVATAFACSAFGVFVASFAQKREQIQGLSTLIILVMSAIGGSMIPLIFMPLFMQRIAVVSVNYWSIQSFYDILWRDLSITDPTFLSRVLVLFAIGAILNLIAIRLFKKNILKLT